MGYFAYNKVNASSQFIENKGGRSLFWDYRHVFINQNKPLQEHNKDPDLSWWLLIHSSMCWSFLQPTYTT